MEPDPILSSPNTPDASTLFKRSLRRQAIRFLAATLVASAVVGALWYLVRSEAREIASSRERRIAAAQGIDKIAALLAGRDEARLLLPKLSERLPDEFDLVVRIPKRLRELGTRADVRVQVDIGAKVAASGEMPSGITLAMKADGTPEALMAFLAAIEAEKEYYRIPEFSMAPLDGGEQFQLTMKGVVALQEPIL